MDKAIETQAKSWAKLTICRTMGWKRIHIDFAGPFLGKMFLIIVDAHSKWPEVVTMASTTSQVTIEALAMGGRSSLPWNFPTS